MDPGCDVRAEVQDGLLQLASGKQVPAMVDCGACGGKKSVEDLILPVVKGLVGDCQSIEGHQLQGRCGEP